MKKFFLLPLLLFSPLCALPIGNPMEASLYSNGLFCNDCYETCCNPCDPCFSWFDAWSIRFGYYGDFVYDRHMETKGHGDGNLDDFEIFTNAGYIALNICNRLDLFGTLGASNIAISANPTVFGIVGSTDFLDLWTETNFSWSAGARLTIWNCGCFYFGIEGQYFYTKLNVNRVRFDSSLTYPDESAEVKYDEWQVGLGTAYLIQIGCSGLSFIPYAALRWAESGADFDNATFGGPSNTATIFDLKSARLWGYGIGATLLFCDVASISIEGRWANEKGLYFNGQFRF